MVSDGFHKGVPASYRSRPAASRRRLDRFVGENLPYESYDPMSPRYVSCFNCNPEGFNCNENHHPDCDLLWPCSKQNQIRDCEMRGPICAASWSAPPSSSPRRYRAHDSLEVASRLRQPILNRDRRNVRSGDTFNDLLLSQLAQTLRQ
jgi:hypothetical protein